MGRNATPTAILDWMLDQLNVTNERPLVQLAAEVGVIEKLKSEFRIASRRAQGVFQLLRSALHQIFALGSRPLGIDTFQVSSMV